MKNQKTLFHAEHAAGVLYLCLSACHDIFLAALQNAVAFPRSSCKTFQSAHKIFAELPTTLMLTVFFRLVPQALVLYPLRIVLKTGFSEQKSVVSLQSLPSLIGVSQTAGSLRDLQGR